MSRLMIKAPGPDMKRIEGLCIPNHLRVHRFSNTDGYVVEQTDGDRQLDLKDIVDIITSLEDEGWDIDIGAILK